MPDSSRNSFRRLDCTSDRISLYAIAQDELIVGTASDEVLVRSCVSLVKIPDVNVSI